MNLQGEWFVPDVKLFLTLELFLHYLQMFLTQIAWVDIFLSFYLLEFFHKSNDKPEFYSLFRANNWKVLLKVVLCSSATLQLLPVKVGIKLERVDTSSVTPFAFVPDDEGHLDFLSASHLGVNLSSQPPITLFLTAEQTVRHLAPSVQCPPGLYFCDTVKISSRLSVSLITETRGLSQGISLSHSDDGNSIFGLTFNFLTYLVFSFWLAQRLL